MAESHKQAFAALVGLRLADKYDDLLDVLGEYYDGIDARVDFILAESDINRVSILSIEDHEEKWGVVPNPSDNLATRKKNVKTKMRMTGALNIPYYVEISASQDVEISIDEHIGFLLDKDLLDIDPMFSSDRTFTFKVTLSEQHRFPFLLDSSLLDIDPLVNFDKNNSVEELILKFKPAHRTVLWEYFNFGFETGDFTAWRAFDDEIDTVTVRTGTYSAKLVAAGSDINGVESPPLQFPANRNIDIDSWHNVTLYTTGTYSFNVDFYSDYNGTELLSSSVIFSKTSTTTGWEQGNKTIGPAELTPDITIPDGARSFRISRKWSGTPTGTAFFDDSNILYL